VTLDGQRAVTAEMLERRDDVNEKGNMELLNNRERQKCWLGHGRFLAMAVVSKRRRNVCGDMELLRCARKM